MRQHFDQYRHSDQHKHLTDKAFMDDMSACRALDSLIESATSIQARDLYQQHYDNLAIRWGSRFDIQAGWPYDTPYKTRGTK